MWVSCIASDNPVVFVITGSLAKFIVNSNTLSFFSSECPMDVVIVFLVWWFTTLLPLMVGKFENAYTGSERHSCLYNHKGKGLSIVGRSWNACIAITIMQCTHLSVKINQCDKRYLWFIYITKFHMVDHSVELSSTLISFISATGKLRKSRHNFQQVDVVFNKL